MNGLLLAGYLSLFGADAATTQYALTTRPTAHELFMTPSPSANAALIAGQASALWFATSKIERPWLRWTVRFGIAGIHGYAAAHNIQEVRR